ncbi:MAG: LAGLIDADG family homing endonuclease, partial [Methanosarcinales archaeon]
RVAKAVAAIDKKYKENAKKSEQTFFEAMKNLEFLPNSPTLFNAGTPYPMLSACFVLPINDDLVSIFTTLKNMAMIQQRGGGTGFSFSRLRPRGDIVRSTRGLASGPVSFIKVYDMATEVIKQGGCISADSLIRTDKGIVPLAEIADCPDFGDTPSKYLVYTNPKFEHAFLAENNGIAKVFNIQTEIGTNIKATYNHLIGIIDGKGNFAWKEAEKITKGEWIIHVLGGHCSEDQPLPRLNKVQHFNAKPIKIPEKISPEFAEILGIYVADGCISYDRLMFAIEDRDIELKKRIKKIMFNLFGLKGREERKPGENWINLIFQSKDLCDYFVKIGWKKENALNANIPQIIFRSSMESAYAFLRGLFEGDGSVHSDGFPILYSISKRLMKEVQQLLFGLGIVSTIHCYKVKNSYGKNLKYHLHIIQEKSVKEFIEKVGFISSRKNKKLVLKEKLIEPFDIIPNQGILLRKICAEKGKGCYHRPLYRSLQHYLSGIKENSKRNMPRKAIKKIIEKFNISHPQLRRMISDDYFYSRVSKISTEKDYTMDIMVPQAEHFVANSILVHNKRRGANMAILRCDHPDIEEFILSKQGKKQLSNFNISVAATDRFMQAASQNKSFSLINPSVLIPPSKKVVRRVNAKALFDIICKAAW